MRTLIIDDEKKAREGIRILLSGDSDMECIGEAKDGMEAIDKILKLNPDLIFLDIQMPGINGFDVLGSIPKGQWPIVIFSTAYDAYALQAFEVQALDYLLKPFSEDRFRRAVLHAKKQHKNNKNGNLDVKLKQLLEGYQNDHSDPALVHSTQGDKAPVIVKSGGKIYFIKLEDIYWVEAMDSYIKIHLSGKVHIVKSSLKSFESRFASTFTKIHRSHLVNLAKVKLIEPYFNGDFYLELDNKMRIRGSRNFKENLPQTL